MAIKVHHLEYSRSLRILWMLEELGLPYTVETWRRDENFRAPDDARRVHPLGRFPMVEIDGEVLVESGAILEYFADREGTLRPGEDEREALQQYRFFMHYAEGSAMPPLLVQLIVTRLRTASMPFFVKPLLRSIAAKMEAGYSGPALELHFGFVNDVLGTRPYFAGDAFSMADIQMFYPAEGALRHAPGRYPHLAAWRERVTQREAYARAAAQGGSAMPEEALG